MAEPLIYLLGLLVGIGGSWFFAGTETGIYTLSRLRLAHHVDRGQRGARRLAQLLDAPRSLICTALIGNNICNYAATVFFGLLLAESLRLNEILTELVSVAVLSPLLFLFGEIHPKNVFRVRADRLMYLLAQPLHVLRLLFLPFSSLLIALAWLMERLIGLKEDRSEISFSRAALVHFVSEGSAEGTLSSAQKQMTEKVIRSVKATVAEAMIPMASVVALPVGASAERLRAALQDRRFARLPVYDTRPDHLIGLLNLYDVKDWSAPDLTVYRKPCFALSHQTPLDDALNQLRHRRVRLAVVLDDGGAAIGVVTIKDLVGWIIGMKGLR